MAKSGKNFSIGTKIFLVSACFSLPIVVLSYFVISNIGDNIRFANMEMAGNAYQVPLEALLKGITDHQRLVHDCPLTAAGCSAKIGAAGDAVRRDLDALRSVDAKYGTTLEFTAEGLAKRGRQQDSAANLGQSWEGIATGLAAAKGVPDPKLDAQYNNALDIVATMITHLGDTSELILDPELDTYHFVVNTLNTLPQNQLRLARMNAAARDAYSHGSFTIADRAALATHAALLQSMDIDQSTGDTQTALHENQNQFHPAVDAFQKEIPSVFQQWSESNSKLVASTKQISTAEHPPVTYEQYSALTQKAQADSFLFWDTGVRNLNNLLQLRVNYYERRRTDALLLSALALLLAAFMAYSVARSMIVPLNKLSLTLTPGATLLASSIRKIGDPSGSGVQDSETISLICDELSAHADDMRSTANALERLVFGSGRVSA